MRLLNFFKRLVMPERKRYVVGFMFSYDRQRVALIRKNRPERHAGLLNGIGGKVEVGETPAEAMVREFTEEAGPCPNGWREVCEVIAADFSLTFFSSWGDVESLQSLTDEVVEVHSTVAAVIRTDIILDLKWAIPLAAQDTYTAVAVERI